MVPRVHDRINAQRMTTEQESGAGTASRPAGRARPVSRAGVFPAASDLLQQAAYRLLAEKHLNHQADEFFAEFTGVHFRVVWKPACSGLASERALPPKPSACCLVARTKAGTDACCEACISRQLIRVARVKTRGLLFTCVLGVRNYWLPIRLLNVTVGAAYVQALDGARECRLRRARPSRSATVRAPRPCRKARWVSRGEVRLAARMLRLIVALAQACSLAELRKADLNKAQLGLLDFVKTNERMRRQIEFLDPTLRTPVLMAGAETHTCQILRHVLKDIHENYRQPITLQRCAADLKLNTTYLSALFSRGVGVPFKAYLTAVRLEKARQLLSDPVHGIAEVAAAVGYASENRFRIAFKKLTGLSPRVWRETLRATPPLVSSPVT